MFALEYHRSGVDFMIQFFYSADSSTPQFRRFMRPNPHGFSRFDDRLGKFEILESLSGERAIEQANYELETNQVRA